MTQKIHPSAIIDPSAELDSSVHVGAYSVIGPQVQIAADSHIASHVVIQGPSRIGQRNQIFSFASLGAMSQDKKDSGDSDTFLEIGDDNKIREYCSMHRGTQQGGGHTRVGHHNWIMAYTHIAHDCQVGNHTVFANGASLAGHVHVDDYAILGGFSGVHQFCQIGRHCFIAAGAIILKDVLPFITVSGHPPTSHGLNSEGLKRHGFAHDTLRYLRQAYKIICRQNLTTRQAIEQLQDLLEQCPEVQHFIDFLNRSARGIVR